MSERENIIAALVDDDFDTIINGGETAYLYDLLITGMKGYDNFTDAELAEEIEERGLIVDMVSRKGGK